MIEDEVPRPRRGFENGPVQHRRIVILPFFQRHVPLLRIVETKRHPLCGHQRRIDRPAHRHGRFVDPVETVSPPDTGPLGRGAGQHIEYLAEPYSVAAREIAYLETEIGLLRIGEGLSAACGRTRILQCRESVAVDVVGHGHRTVGPVAERFEIALRAHRGIGGFEGSHLRTPQVILRKSPIHPPVDFIGVPDHGFILPAPGQSKQSRRRHCDPAYIYSKTFQPFRFLNLTVKVIQKRQLSGMIMNFPLYFLYLGT